MGEVREVIKKLFATRFGHTCVLVTDDVILDCAYHHLTTELIVFGDLSRNAHIDNAGTKGWCRSLVMRTALWNEFHATKLTDARMNKILGYKRLAAWLRNLNVSRSNVDGISLSPLRTLKSLLLVSPKEPIWI
ncbi:MAG: hypothetical protein DMF26_00460 [Verrucomicrobia bacterium]|nr:MAG: hypothetical protein DMF26_00460 [Verrucomicrobiota bacterium]